MADLYAVINTLQSLEKAYIRDALLPKEWVTGLIISFICPSSLPQKDTQKQKQIFFVFVLEGLLKFWVCIIQQPISPWYSSILADRH